MSDPHTWQIDVSIDSALDTGLMAGLSIEWARLVVQCALLTARSEGPPGQVSVLFTDDSTLRGLNLKYRGLDETTDVLSFSCEFPGHWEGPDDPSGANPGDAVATDGFVLPPGHLPPLGEVIISCPQAQRQAAEKACEYPEELALLLVHGVLHLAGFDHLEESDAHAMQSLERVALDQVFPTPAVRP